MIILVGLPGSGKSTFRKTLEYSYVCQDELGSRDKCAEKVNELVKQAKEDNNQDFTIIIDRTNIDKRQRSNWIKLAQYHGFTSIECVEFKVDPNECLKRILARKDHETIDPSKMSLDKITSIVRKFNKGYEVPSLDEGFDIIITSPANLVGEKSSSIRS